MWDEARAEYEKKAKRLAAFIKGESPEIGEKALADALYRAWVAGYEG
jgi:hypothetical protein